MFITILLGGVNLLSSVSSQQRFEAMNVKALGASELSDSPGYSSRTDQFYLKISENISSRHEGMLTQKTQRRERENKHVHAGERERPPGLWLFFLYVVFFFFPPPGSAPCRLDSDLPEVLTPVLGPSFVLFPWAFPFLVY